MEKRHDKTTAEIILNAEKHAKRFEDFDPDENSTDQGEHPPKENSSQ